MLDFNNLKHLFTLDNQLETSIIKKERVQLSCGEKLIGTIDIEIGKAHELFWSFIEKELKIKLPNIVSQQICFVKEITIIAIRKSSFLIAKQCIQKIEELLKQYKIIICSVKNNHPFLESYKKILKRWTHIAVQRDQKIYYLIYETI